MHKGFWLGNLRERDHMVGAAVDGEIKIRLIWGSGMWSHERCRSGSGYGEVAGTCELSDKPSGSIKGTEFLE